MDNNCQQVWEETLINNECFFDEGDEVYQSFEFTYILATHRFLRFVCEVMMRILQHQVRNDDR